MQRPRSRVFIPKKVVNLCVYTVCGRKYSYTTKYPCSDSAIYRLNIELGPKMGIETCRSQKFVVLALTLEKFF